MKWTEEQEREANLFAMYLLMPEEMVRKQVKKLGGSLDINDDKNIKTLARKFAVSEQLMTLRIAQIYTKVIQ